MFMEPRNIFRAKEAVLSVLAGDVFGNSPIGPSLFAFKTIYFVAALLNPKTTIRAWRARRQNIRSVHIDGMMN